MLIANESFNAARRHLLSSSGLQTYECRGACEVTLVDIDKKYMYQYTTQDDKATRSAVEQQQIKRNKF